MKKVLFLDDCNLNAAKNPEAYLVEMPEQINTSILRALENIQNGAGRIGGDWKRIMEDGKIEYKLLSSGHKSDYHRDDYDEIYQVISGNY